MSQAPPKGEACAHSACGASGRGDHPTGRVALWKNVCGLVGVSDATAVCLRVRHASCPVSSGQSPGHLQTGSENFLKKLEEAMPTPHAPPKKRKKTFVHRRRKGKSGGKNEDVGVNP